MASECLYSMCCIVCTAGNASSLCSRPVDREEGARMPRLRPVEEPFSDTITSNRHNMTANQSLCRCVATCEMGTAHHGNSNREGLTSGASGLHLADGRLANTWWTQFGNVTVLTAALWGMPAEFGPSVASASLKSEDSTMAMWGGAP